MHTFIQTNLSERIFTITLNRPEKRNALSGKLVDELKDALIQAEKNEAIKIIILKANGPVFSAGADLEYLTQLQSFTYEENLADSKSLAALFEIIYKHKKIIIAQVEGHAIAGGCGLAAIADFTFATPEAQFGYTEVKIGFIPAIVSIFLLRKMGETKAKELLFTGKLISAELAQKYGLIHSVCVAENMEQEVQKLALELCVNCSGASLSMTKEMISKVQELPLQEALHYATEMNAQCRGTADCKKGIAAFLTKEKMSW